MAVQSVVDVTHYGVFNEQAGDPLSVLSLQVRGGTERTLSLTVPAKKYYVVDPGAQEFELQDATVAMSRRLPDGLFGWTWRASPSLTLPLSEYSRLQGRRTRMGLSLATGKTYGTVSLQTSLTGRYYWNEFKTTVAEDGRGGSPLPWFSYGLSQSVSYSWHRKWQGTLSGSYSELWSENIGESDDAPWEPVHPYTVDLQASYTPHVGYTGSFGMSQGSRLEQYGKIDFALFDAYATTWFVSLLISRDLHY